MEAEQVRTMLESIAAHMISAVTLVLVVIAVYYVTSRGLGLLQRRRGLAEPLVSYVRKVLRWMAVLAAVLLALQSFGLLRDAWAMLTAIMAMVAIGFVAVWSVLSNTLCSFILLIARPFQVGDTIEIPPDNLKGQVVNFNMLFTTLQSESGVQIQIPNNMFFQRVVLRHQGRSQVPLDEQLMREADAEVG